MLARIALSVAATGFITTLASCGLVKLPFKVVGAAAEGTAYVGKKAATATADAFTETEEEKAEDAKKKAKKEAEKAAKAAKEGTKPGTTLAPAPLPQPAPAPQPLPQSGDYLPPLPGTDQPLPDDSTVPYQN